MKRITALPKQHFVACFLCALFISGCSGSNDSNAIEQANVDNEVDSAASDVQPPSDILVPSSDQDNVEDGDNSAASDVQLPTDVPDSSSQATTRVTFDITVPAYMSNELQVRLESGAINTTAAFVRDESWSVSAVFPTNTDNLSVVTFFDQNGAITLGTAEQNFRTGTAASEVIQITANQFDTNRWDSDNDGISNLDELIAGTNPDVNHSIQPVQASMELIPDKTFRINWQPSMGAEFYRVLENPDGSSGFTAISEDLDSSTSSFDHRVTLFSRVNAQYVVEACNANGCVDSDPLFVTGTLDAAIGYFKASNTSEEDFFGGSVSLSADGNTMAVGAGVEGSEFFNSGAVYLFSRNGGRWQQQAFLKASNPHASQLFGSSVSLSADGNALAVGAERENSNATGVNGDQTDTSSVRSGAVYVFARSNELWQQQAYLKASNTGADDRFGVSVSLSADGNTLAVGASREDSAATGINGDQADNSVTGSGAVYIFTQSSGLWQQQAYLKASNTGRSDFFGQSLSLSADGNTLAVGGQFEDSAATGINGDQADNSTLDSGAVYVFFNRDGIWQQQAYLKASNAGRQHVFGSAVSLSADGNTLAASSFIQGGAVYLFVRSISSWQQQTFIKASNANEFDEFGVSLSLSADGNTLAVGARGEESSATGINGDQTGNSSPNAGAAYIWVLSDDLWQQLAYLKAFNTNPFSDSEFGHSISISADGSTLAIGAPGESASTTGINVIDQDAFNAVDNNAGAVYLF